MRRVERVRRAAPVRKVVRWLRVGVGVCWIGENGVDIVGRDGGEGLGH